METSRKNPLNPDSEADRNTTKQLELSCIRTRLRMLRLGEEHAVRLHYGAMFSCAEILVCLYGYWMRHDPSQPQWDGRDRFVLSKGHAAPILYAVLSRYGYFGDSEFDLFRKLGGMLQGHPDRSKTPGVDCTTGSLGQGLPVACGMALAAAGADAPFRVYALISDGECNEGSIWEAALIAANLRLDRLTALLDLNGQSSYGQMDGRNGIEPLRGKWESFGWNVVDCDGHDFVSLTRALGTAHNVPDKPSVILCRTTKNRGIPYAEVHDMRSNYALTTEQRNEAQAHLLAKEKELTSE